MAGEGGVLPRPPRGLVGSLDAPGDPTTSYIDRGTARVTATAADRGNSPGFLPEPEPQPSSQSGPDGGGKEVVAQVAINPNTVLKAYRQLEHEGLVAGRPGRGTSPPAS